MIMFKLSPSKQAFHIRQPQFVLSSNSNVSFIQYPLHVIPYSYFFIFLRLTLADSFYFPSNNLIQNCHFVCEIYWVESFIKILPNCLQILCELQKGHISWEIFLCLLGKNICLTTAEGVIRPLGFPGRELAECRGAFFENMASNTSEWAGRLLARSHRSSVEMFLLQFWEGPHKREWSCHI